MSDPFDIEAWTVSCYSVTYGLIFGIFSLKVFLTLILVTISKDPFSKPYYFYEKKMSLYKHNYNINTVVKNTTLLLSGKVHKTEHKVGLLCKQKRHLRQWDKVRKVVSDFANDV